MVEIFEMTARAAGGTFCQVSGRIRRKAARTCGVAIWMVPLLACGAGRDGGADAPVGSTGATSAVASSSGDARPSDDTTSSMGSTTHPGDSSTEPMTGVEPPVPEGSSTSSPEATSSSTGDESSSSSGGDAAAFEFEEVGGIVSIEAEHYFEQTNTEATAARWYTFVDGEDPPPIDCVTDTPCGGPESPNCNQYANCDPDAIDPGAAIGGAYVEHLPDRRRNDTEPGTSGLGVCFDPACGARLSYRVNFTQVGRYYVWAHARGQGPAANGIHLGIDGGWPVNDLVDPGNMRMQFPGGWAWTQNRRGATQHTGVSATEDVSLRDANIWLQVDAPGVHVVQWGMREDGLEFDKFVMALDPNFEPVGDGPPETSL